MPEPLLVTAITVVAIVIVGLATYVVVGVTRSRAADIDRQSQQS